MAYKTILVHVDASERCRARIAIALRLAREFEAHLVGLHARVAVALPTVVQAEPVVAERLQQAAATDHWGSLLAGPRSRAAAGL